jgi:hypothetical protein
MDVHGQTACGLRGILLATMNHNICQSLTTPSIALLQEWRINLLKIEYRAPGPPPLSTKDASGTWQISGALVNNLTFADTGSGPMLTVWLTSRAPWWRRVFS